MATIKSFTDLQQSKKLAEILPIESADMGWNVFVDETTRILPIDDWDLVKNGSGNVKFYPAWSLASLLDILKYPSLTQNVENKWFITDWTRAYPKSEYGFDNPVGACVSMVEKLHELNLL